MKDYQFAYGKGSVTVPLDERSVRAVLHGNEAPAMQDIRAGLVESLENPIGAKPLREEIPAGARVALVVSDMSRFWMRQDLVIPHLVAYLHTACGVPYERLTIVVANGTHLGGSEQELRTLVTPEVFDRVKVENHDCEARILSTSARPRTIRPCGSIIPSRQRILWSASARVPIISWQASAADARASFPA